MRPMDADAADFICRFTNIGHFVSFNPVEDNRA
jgi:hypothetical protein